MAEFRFAVIHAVEAENERDALELLANGEGDVLEVRDETVPVVIDGLALEELLSDLEGGVVWSLRVWSNADGTEVKHSINAGTWTIGHATRKPS